MKDPNKNKFVSVIMPVYNGALFIEEAIKSVLKQSYDYFELIIINDSSTDNTSSLIRKFQRDKRVKFLELQENMGQGYCRNLGIECSKGEIIAFLDADDVWEPEKLLLQIKFVEEKHISICFTNYSFINKESSIIKDKQNITKNIVGYEDLLRNNYIGTSTAIFDKSILSRVRFTNYRKKQDYIFWLDLLKESKQKAFFINSTLVHYRKHESQTTKNKSKLVRLHYEVLRKTQGLNKIDSIRFTFTWAFYGLIKHYIFHD